MAAEIRPQVIMIRAIQTRAPTFSIARLLGTSNKKYATKKMPPPRPNTVEDSPTSLFICSAANPAFTRSTNATK